MTIGVECPHCETRFQLSDDLIGKSMRCPNSDCREVFTVAPLATTLPVPEPIPEPIAAPIVPPLPQSGSITDFVPVFEAEPVSHPDKQLPYDRVDAPLIPVLEAELAPSTAPLLEAEPVAPILKATPILPALPLPSKAEQAKAGPREINWNDQAPPPPEMLKPKSVVRAEDDQIPIRTRPQKSGLPKMIFLGLLTLLLLVVGGTIGVFVYRGMKVEEESLAQADALYQEGRFGEAQKKYEELATTYPDSKNSERYRFFTKLASVRASVTAVTTKETPGPALDQLRKFLSEHTNAPIAQPNSGYGADIVQAGRVMCETLNDHAADRITTFRTNRTKRELLTEADQAIAQGRDLIPVLEKFRDTSSLPFDAIRAKYGTTETEVKKERDRLAALDPWRDLANDPTDQSIERFEKEMRAVGLAKDVEVQEIAANAKAELRKRVQFRRDPIAAIPAPPNASAVTAIAPRVHESPTPKPGTDGATDTVFTVVKGVLYVMDAHTGTGLWTDRVATDSSAADAPLRFTSEDGSVDWLIVPTLLDGEAGLTARHTRTGAPVWHQTLPAAVLGRPVRIGNRIFVALSDDNGTLIQLDLTTGGILSQCELFQPVGGGLAAFRGQRSSHGFLVVPADARRIFLFEISNDAENRPKLPQMIRVLATDHPKDSLRGEPLLIDPDDPAALRRLVLTQTDLPNTMKLRSFALPNLKDLAVPSTVGETRPDQTAEVSVNGWSWFPPVSDGERVAVATDSGTFAVFGLNQPGNNDKPLHLIPGKKPAEGGNLISRGLVVSADEDNFWAVTNSQLVRLRAGVDPSSGYHVAPHGMPLLVGEPIARGQVRPALHFGFLTVQVTKSGTVQMIAFDLNNGEVRWRRQLGARVLTRPMALAEGGHLIVDEAAGVYRATPQVESEQLRLETIAEPLANVPDPAFVAITADRKTMFVFASEPTPDGQKVLIRKFEQGKFGGDRAVSLPSPLAGVPVVFGSHILMPLANGVVYRATYGESEVKQGPQWRGPDAPTDSKCYLTVISESEFLATDGGKRVTRWKWVNEQTRGEKAGGPWETNERITAAALVISSGGNDRVMVADEKGVSVFDPTKPTNEPARRWLGMPNEMNPGGRVSSLVSAFDRVIAAIEGKALLGIDPTKDQPDWAVPPPPVGVTGEVVGIHATENHLVVTYQSGYVRFVNPKTGEVVGEAVRSPGAPLATASAVPGDPNRVILANSDGTLSVIPVVFKR